MFAGGSYFNWFPLRGLTSPGWADMSWPDRIVDYFWHLALPLSALVIGSFAGLTMLTKNSFLEEINKQYVMTARAKGLTEQQIARRHVMRNALMPVVTMAGVQAGALLGGAVVVETVFAWPGLGLLAYESLFARDLNLLLGIFFVSTCLVVLVNLLVDLAYSMLDPRIERR